MPENPTALPIMHHSNVHHERSDMSWWAAAYLGGSLILVGLVAFFGLGSLFRYLDARANREDASTLPLAQQQREKLSELPPAQRLEQQFRNEPALEGLSREHPAGDWKPWPPNNRRFVSPEQERLENYGWMDEKKGIVHVPWQRAAETALQNRDKYLPSRPAVGGDKDSTQKPAPLKNRDGDRDEKGDKK
jgi:hypothetical protein